MTKSEIIAKISEVTGLTKVETETVVNGFFATVSEALGKGETINFRGFGNFVVKHQKANGTSHYQGDSSHNYNRCWRGVARNRVKNYFIPITPTATIQGSCPSVIISML